MAARRSQPKAGSGPPAGSPTGPLLSATIVAGALGYAIHLLVRAGSLRWPPTEVFEASTTLVGCLAMVGPLLLWRRSGASEVGLGDLVWMGGGLCLWTVNLVALTRGRAPAGTWVAPVEPTLMGAFALAIGLTAWQAGRARWAWTWTSVVGCALGLFWVVAGVVAAWPAGWGERSPLDGRLPGLGAVLP